MYKALVTIGGTPIAPANTLLLRPGVNLNTGEKHFASEFGQPTSLEIDVLTLASAIFASDLAFKRGERENITRRIELTIPVINLAVFREVTAQLQYILYRLSHDAWAISFIQRDGTPEASQKKVKGESQKVLLFSGGLDSFAASILYGEAGERVQLVSHVTANRAVSEPQKTLFDYLQQQFPNQFQRFAARVGGADKSKKGFPFPSDQAREETQRTRSFLFLALAGLVARRQGAQEIVLIAENGQMAIHLPLTAARIGAFSTHTAHPEFVYLMGEFLSKLLSYPLHISNPFLYQTKAEVVEGAVKRHLEATARTVSCWKASRIAGNYNHCGFCIPCLIRRIALEKHQITLSEYKRDLFVENVPALPSNDDGKRNLSELGEFVKIFEEEQNSQALLEDIYPDLINPYIDSVHAVEMYRRFATEARAIFNCYPQIQDFLQ